MPTALEKVLQMKIVAVVAIHNAGHSDALADAVVEGGLPCAESTFRTGAAANAIRIITKRGDMLVGAGTVL